MLLVFGCIQVDKHGVLPAYIHLSNLDVCVGGDGSKVVVYPNQRVYEPEGCAVIPRHAVVVELCTYANVFRAVLFRSELDVIEIVRNSDDRGSLNLLKTLKFGVFVACVFLDTEHILHLLLLRLLMGFRLVCPFRPVDPSERMEFRRV